MANPSNSPNRETSLPMAPGAAAQAMSPGKGQGGDQTNIEALITAGPVDKTAGLCADAEYER